MTHRRENWISMEEADKMLVAAQDSLRDHTILWLMLKRGLRVGEVVGSHRNGANLPGIQKEDLREDSIWIEGKKGHRDPWPCPPEIMNALRLLATHKHGRVFRMGDENARRLVKKYAQLAGIEDANLIHPHTLRHAFGTQAARKTRDPYKVRDLMRHSGIGVSSVYVNTLPPEEKKKLLEEEFA